MTLRPREREREREREEERGKDREMERWREKAETVTLCRRQTDTQRPSTLSVAHDKSSRKCERHSAHTHTHLAAIAGDKQAYANK